jgi:hypothetical protein
MTGVATMFAPPDLKHVEVQPIDSYMMELDGSRRSLVFGFSEYEAVYDPDAATELDPKPLRSRSIAVAAPTGTRRETLYLFERRMAPEKTTFEAEIGMLDVPCSFVSLFGPSAALRVTLSCDRREDCDDADAMFASIALLGQRLEVVKDGAR